MIFELNQIENDLFAIADFYWKKKSGDQVLISKKGDILNLPLLKKLSLAQCELIVENGIDLKFQDEMSFLYHKNKSELSVRNKIPWREKFTEELNKEFIESHKTQFELNQLGWKIFSTLSYEEGLSFIEYDRDIFERNLSVASSYAFCAFLLGHYDPTFLGHLFSSTLINLMQIGREALPLGLKEKLELLRDKESFDQDDQRIIREVVNVELITQTVMFEKYDGTGIRQLNYREMSALDIVYVAINHCFGFDHSDDGDENVLKKIKNGKLKCEKNILKMLQRVLDEKKNEQLSASA